MTPRPVARPVLDPTSRPAVTAAGGAAAVVLATLAGRYARSTGSGRLDRRMREALDGVPAGRGGAAWRLVDAFDPAPFARLVVGVGGACLLAGRPRLAAVAVAGPVLTGLATTGLKRLVGRRFRRGELAFPSGHTGGATALGLAAGLLLTDLVPLPPGARTAALGLAAAGAGTGMGAALVALELHYPTDAIGGVCTAVVVMGGTALAVDRLTEHYCR